MARIRRPAALVGAVALAGAFVTGPARADTPEVFAGEAAATSLELSVLGRQATFGGGRAEASSAGVAKGTGAGYLSTTVEAVDDELGKHAVAQEANASKGQTVTKPRACRQPEVAVPDTDPEVPDPSEGLPDFITVGLVCSAASAANTALPSARGEGSIAEADVHLETVVKHVEDEAGSALPIGSTLATVLDAVCAEAAEACPATTTVADLVDSVLKTQTLDIQLGTSTSSVTTGPTTVTSEAIAAGGVVKILPLPQANGVPSADPVVTITVGDAKAKAVYNRSTGMSTMSADGALVRIDFNTAITDTFPTLANGIAVDPLDLVGAHRTIKGLPADAKLLVTVCDNDRAICILEGTPLQSRVYLAAGGTKVHADGSVSAVADAVRLQLLMGVTDFIAERDEGDTNEGAKLVAEHGLADPGLHLALAHAEAAVGGKQAQVGIQQDPDPDDDGDPDDDDNDNDNGNGNGPGRTSVHELPRGEVPLELPRTGGFPILPVAGAGMLSLAVLFRRALAKATG